VQAASPEAAPPGREALARLAAVAPGGPGPASGPGVAPGAMSAPGPGSLVSPALTQQGPIHGTSPELSPDQWGSGEPTDHRTDLWAVGVMMSEMLTGRHPLAELQGWSLGMSVSTLGEPMPPVRSANMAVPDDLAAIIDRCLAKSISERMPSAQALLDLLEP